MVATKTPYYKQISVRQLSLNSKPLLQVRPRLSILLGTVGDLHAFDSRVVVSLVGFSITGDDGVVAGTKPFPLIQASVGDSTTVWPLIQQAVGSFQPLISGDLHQGGNDVLEIRLLEDDSGFSPTATVDLFLNVQLLSSDA